MPISGDVVLLEFGVPQGHEAGFPRPAVVVTADRLLRRGAPVVQVVPLTSTLRRYDSEVLIEAEDANGLDHDSAAQCQQVRSVSATRLGERVGSVSAVQLHQIREILAFILDL